MKIILLYLITLYFIMTSPLNPNYNSNSNELKLSNNWTVYIHNNFNKNWNAESYIKVMQINTNKSFWEFFNNFENLNYVDNQFFIMREYCSPMWEDLPDGANVVMSIKQLNVRSVLDVWTILCAKILTDFIDVDKYYVKGIVFNMKYDLVNIKLIVDNAVNETTGEFSNTSTFIKSFLEKEFPDNKYNILPNKRDTTVNYTTYNPRHKSAQSNPYPKKKYQRKY